ncbi:hypothetical protein E5F05_18405 [Deinococcus metallilatus]|uniref:RNA-binding Zn-ribbon protein involved in translation (DUF1610 family) n=2 Tax=Deinococcus TaxID=1298 RepID=A0AAJ5F293_9DEIO|nr:hypothetical protein [Deinococcus metallilatus]MBB5296222.1 putative RNA-binding Zn-ribbon protein involved in translation (DUF1610 family) [Deinococcus metallilatus]QBY09731.1 hypothetical protein E5F05_18405 [Deinococcus metallilatus]RXJ08929.1 hypothetical protein ERJ73_17240 [Deinococcus metallilatus]TLK23692.1 hypothetical protein FCS05_15840 [Deinococcus metallilatus]
MKQALRNKSLRPGDAVYPVSGRGYAHVCPSCGQPLTLYDLRDGDQAYWCDPCGKGHRAGDPPTEALRPLPNAG